MSSLFLILTLTLTKALSEIQELKFSVPGMYTLKPEDYNFNSYIIIEAWGGGASGSCSINISGPNGAGGGSGSYIKAKIMTNGRSFNIKVGEGGEFRYCSENYGPYFLYGKNGQSTFIVSFKDETLIEVEGGKTIQNETDTEIAAKIMKVEEVELIQVANGRLSSYSKRDRLICNCADDGGSAYKGGEGGLGYSELGFGFCTRTKSTSFIVRNGMIPGGGGGGLNCMKNELSSTNLSGKGASGKVIVFYIKDIQESNKNLGDGLVKDNL